MTTAIEALRAELQQAAEQKDHAAVVRIATAILALGADTDAHYKRGLAHIALGQHAQGRADFDRVIELWPESRNAVYNRGLCFRGTGDYALARADFAQYLTKYPDDADAIRMLEDCTQRLNTPAELRPREAFVRFLGYLVLCFAWVGALIWGVLPVANAMGAAGTGLVLVSTAGILVSGVYAVVWKRVFIIAWAAWFFPFVFECLCANRALQLVSGVGILAATAWAGWQFYYVYLYQQVWRGTQICGAQPVFIATLFMSLAVGTGIFLTFTALDSRARA